MGNDFKNKDSAKSNPKVLSGFLASALDMEDEISNSIYCDYLQRSNWPKELKEKTFEKIRGYLNVLINDTQRHQQEFLNLKNKLERQ